MTKANKPNMPTYDVGQKITDLRTKRTAIISEICVRMIEGQMQFYYRVDQHDHKSGFIRENTEIEIFVEREGN